MTRSACSILTRRGAAAIFVAAFTAACGQADAPMAPDVAPSFGKVVSGADLVLCKWTDLATPDQFDFRVQATGGKVPGNGRFTLSSTPNFGVVGETCVVVWSSTGGPAVVTITEEATPGWDPYLAHANDMFVTPVDGTIQVTVDGQNSAVAWFKNTPVPVDMTPGRMTGGGGQITIGDVRITRGFTIHCDITLSNNVEVNWNGNRWHLDKPLTDAVCIDQPGIEPAPPPAPFDTFQGEGLGRLNNVDGSFIRFEFIDAGEPGGSNDRATIEIWAPGADPSVDAPVLQVDGFLDHGNLQAHYDQPHK